MHRDNGVKEKRDDNEAFLHQANKVWKRWRVSSRSREAGWLVPEGAEILSDPLHGLLGAF